MSNKTSQQVPLVDQLRSVPNYARVLVETPNPLGFDVHSIPVGALCKEAANRIAELERQLAKEREALRLVNKATYICTTNLHDWKDCVLEVQRLTDERGRREAAEVILREMAQLYAGQIDNTGNYCNQLHDSARAHFARYYKD